MSVIPPLYTASNTCEEGDDNDDERGACSPDHEDDGRGDGDDAEDDYHKDYAKGGVDDAYEDERGACSPDDDADVVMMI